MTESLPPRRNLLPVAIGIALTCILLLGLAFLARQQSQRERVVPAVTLTAPGHGQAVDSPLVLNFSSSHEISLKPGGWGFEQLHLHAWVDRVAHMPAAADIQQMDNGEFTWTIAAAPRGPHTVQLGWADAAHRELASGRSDTVKIVIR